MAAQRRSDHRLSGLALGPRAAFVGVVGLAPVRAQVGDKQIGVGPAVARAVADRDAVADVQVDVRARASRERQRRRHGEWSGGLGHGQADGAARHEVGRQRRGLHGRGLCAVRHVVDREDPAGRRLRGARADRNRDAGQAHDLCRRRRCRCRSRRRRRSRRRGSRAAAVGVVSGPEGFEPPQPAASAARRSRRRGLEIDIGERSIPDLPPSAVRAVYSVIPR